MADNRVKAKEHWNNRTRLDYRRMYMRHVSLWEYVEEFITEFKIKSILEIGCGPISSVEHLVREYTAVDLNENTNAIHKDFTTMDSSEVPKHDLLLACAVIEHCDGYMKFFSKVKEFNFSNTLISFFGGIDRGSNKIKLLKSGVYLNKYSKNLMEEELQRLGLGYRFLKIANATVVDDVLIIKGRA